MSIPLPVLQEVGGKYASMIRVLVLHESSPQLNSTRAIKPRPDFSALLKYCSFAHSGGVDDYHAPYALHAVVFIYAGRTRYCVDNNLGSWQYELH
jgi:hypothetical protein